MIQRLLKVISVSNVMQAKNNRPYCVVKFESRNSMPDGTPVLSAIGIGTRTVFADFTDEKGNEFKGDPLFNQITSGQAKPGSLIEGQIVKVRTTPYRIAGSDNDACFYTCVVFGHEDMTSYINKRLKDSYACVIDEHGYLTAPEQTEKPVAAPSTNSVTQEA